MDQAITMEHLNEYHTNDTLGKLECTIPIRPWKAEDVVMEATIGLELSTLYETIMDDNSANSNKPVSLCLIGSVLHGHFDQPYSRMPSDLDITCILDSHEGPDIVIPEHIVEPTIERVPSGYGYRDVLKDAAVYTKTPKRINRTLLGMLVGTDTHTYVDNAIPLHISYRTMDQVRNGAGKGDTVSDSLIAYGVPFVGKEIFEDMVNDISTPERNPLHDVQWYESEGKHNARVVFAGDIF